jgi:hypothetical protein
VIVYGVVGSRTEQAVELLVPREDAEVVASGDTTSPRTPKRFALRRSSSTLYPRGSAK